MAVADWRARSFAEDTPTHIRYTHSGTHLLNGRDALLQLRRDLLVEQLLRVRQLRLRLLQLLQLVHGGAGLLVHLLRLRQLRLRLLQLLRRLYVLRQRHDNLGL